MPETEGEPQLSNKMTLLQPVGGPELLQCHGSGMGLAPVAHRIEQRPERLSQRRNGVDHSRRSVRVHRAFNDSRALQFAELLGERSLRDPCNTTLQLGETLGALEKLIENGGFPTPADDTCGGFHRTELWMLGHYEPSSILYTTYRIMLHIRM
jgi:hypothetical protein